MIDSRYHHYSIHSNKHNFFNFNRPLWVFNILVIGSVKANIVTVSDFSEKDIAGILLCISSTGLRIMNTPASCTIIA